MKNLRLGLFTIFLMMVSVIGYSQACPGNMVAVSLQNFSQTATTVEFDVYLTNTSSNTMRFNTAAVNTLHSAGMLPVGATGSVSIVMQPSACDFPGYPNGSVEAYNTSAKNIKFIGTVNPSGTVMLTSTAKRFCRMRFTSSLPWTQSTPAQFTINPTNLANPTRGATQVQVYCNANSNSTTLAATSTLTLGGSYSYPLNDLICATAASQTASSAVTCFGGTNGSSTITMSPTPTVASITYTVDGGASQSATLSSGAFTITGLAAGTHTVVVSNNGCSDVTATGVAIDGPSQLTNTIAATSCDSYVWEVNGQTYNTSGTYTGTTTNSNGCTVNETLNLTINNSTASTLEVTACDTYTWSANGETYTTSGTHVYTSTNDSGCTDTKTLVLTINTSSVYYADADGDGFGNPAVSTNACSLPTG